MVKCPKCGFENDDSTANCSSCNINLQWALENFDQYKTEPEARRELEERLAQLIVTTTFSIEGRRIERYLGVFTSEVVLGTDLLTELGGDIADILGRRVDGFQSKLHQARENAIRELKCKVLLVDADAIVGLDIDYSSLSRNLLMVAATGTAVKLVPDG